jgi:uncharacterized repeat protein (TIGR01451 family)
MTATLLGAASPASAAPASPQLSIAIDDGRPSATVGTVLNYTITLHNMGSAKISGLLVSQATPAGAKITSAGSNGTISADAVGWKVNLAAAEQLDLHTVLTVSATPTSVLRLAVVACARIGGASAPLVCGSDSDQLPAGHAAEVSHAAAGRPAPAPQSPAWWYLEGAAGAVLLLVASVALVWRRKQRHAA